MDPSGTGIERLFNARPDPASFALDSAGGKFYWTSNWTSPAYRPQRANLDGTHQESFGDSDLSSSAIALDTAHQNVYWTQTVEVGLNQWNLFLRRSNLDASNIENVVRFPPGDGVYTMVIDERAGKLYYAQPSAPGRDARIGRMNLDGSGDEIIVTNARGQGVNSIALDFSPRVERVHVGGFVWPAGSPPLPLGANDQLDPLPWTTSNLITLEFTEPVSIPVGALSMTGHDGRSYPLFGPVTGPGTAPGRYRASWLLPYALDRDRLTLRLAESVSDVGENRIDGDWVDGASVYSGDGVPGGAFVFTINVLPGDADQSGAVTVADAVQVLNRVGQSHQDSAYSLFADIDGSGQIDLTDVRSVMLRAFQTLPPAVASSPGASQVPEPASVLIAALCVLAGAARWRIWYRGRATRVVG